MDISHLSEYSSLSLEARKQLIELILQQDRDVRLIFQQAADELANEIRRLEKEGQSHLIPALLAAKVAESATTIEKGLSELFKRGYVISVEAGMHQSKQATLRILQKGKIDWQPIERVYFRKHSAAVEAMQTRVLKGLTVSDRIWGQSRVARQSMGAIIQEAIATGEHPYKVAEMLEDYVRNGAKSLVSQYPEMIARLEGNIPMDMCYESLRLARTEMAAAFGEAAIQAAELNPSNQGIKWSTSNGGNTCDKCKSIASTDNGLGEGVYRRHELPDYPAHPNCLCTLSEVVEDMNTFVDRLIEWQQNPLAHQDIERWYQNVYKGGMIS
ncbi:structural protein [Sporosarcina sp. ITBMC105]